MAEFGRTNAGEILKWASSLFGILGGKVDKAVRRGIELIRAGVIGLAKELATFAAQTGAILARVVGLLRRFWARVVLPLLRRLDRWATVVQTWLRETFGPIIRALLWLRQKILDFYTRWLRPIFDTIDILRRILSVLSLLQLDFARKLDRKLAELEDRLLRPIREAVDKLNEAIDWVDRIVTLDGLFQRLTLIRSLTRDVRLVWNLWNNAQSKPLTEDERRAEATAGNWPTTEENMRTYVATLERHDGPRSAAITELLADVDLRLSRAA